MKEKTHPLIIRLPYSLYEQFIQEAKRRRESYSSFGKIVIEHFLQESSEERIEIKIDELGDRIETMFKSLIQGG